VYLFQFGTFFFIVNTLREELLHRSLLTLGLGGFVLLDEFEMVTKVFFIWQQSDSIFDISKGLVEVENFIVGN